MILILKDKDTRNSGVQELRLRVQEERTNVILNLLRLEEKSGFTDQASYLLNMSFKMFLKVTISHL